MKYGMYVRAIYLSKKDRNGLIDVIKTYLKDNKPEKKKFKRWNIEEIIQEKVKDEEEVE